MKQVLPNSYSLTWHPYNMTFMRDMNEAFFADAIITVPYLTEEEILTCTAIKNTRTKWLNINSRYIEINNNSRSCHWIEINQLPAVQSQAHCPLTYNKCGVAHLLTISVAKVQMVILRMMLRRQGNITGSQEEEYRCKRYNGGSKRNLVWNVCLVLTLWEISQMI